MNKSYKPKNYNSVSPYLIVDGAQKMIDLLKKIFHVEELRRFDKPDKTIMHAELRIDDSVIMLADSSKEFPANQFLLHVYVSDVDQIFQKAVAMGCKAVEKPQTREGDSDKRGSFKDFSGNLWTIGTQVEN